MLADITALGRGLVSFAIKQSKTLKTRQSRKTFRYLIDAGYIKMVGDDKVRLTDTGKINILNELVKKRKPDGKMRVIIFDIPEKMRACRNAFRRHLADLGFKMEQQSVWVSKLPCEDLAALVIDYHRLKKFASLIVGRLVR